MTMTAPSVRIEPPIDQWRLGQAEREARAELFERINARARRLGTAELQPHHTPVIATGHQAQLWHPGILAKDIAMDIAAERYKAQTLHLIVDQDTNEAWRLDLPSVEGDRLRARSLSLAEQAPGVPTGYQPPADPGKILDQLAGLGSQGVGLLIDAIKNLPACESLAEQLAGVMSRLKSPYAGDIPVMLVSDLAGLEVYETLVARMLHEAHTCATAYNRAVGRYPDAGMTPLVVNRLVVELPLWAIRRGAPRRRVFVDIADSEPLFVFGDGEPVDRSIGTLLPRALMLTAVMRSALCDLFIHGTGGLLYDRVTEDWWRAWTGESLAPMAGVTADLYMPFKAPVAGREQLTRAVWHRHHLKHNLDRALSLEDDLANEKQALLAHMDDDRDRLRRRKAFKRVHEINRALVDQYPEALVEAAVGLEQARVGRENAEIAGRRDWSITLYPQARLHTLRTAIAGHAVECPS